MVITENQCRLFRCDTDYDRWSQYLRVDFIALHFGQYLFILYLLMCSMLVNHQHFVAILNNPVGIEHLPHNSILLSGFFGKYLFIKKIELFRLLDNDMVFVLDHAKIFCVRFSGGRAKYFPRHGMRFGLFDAGILFGLGFPVVHEKGFLIAALIGFVVAAVFF